MPGSLVSISDALKRSFPPVIICLAVLTASCSSILGETPVDTSPEVSGSGSTDSSPTDPDARNCVRFTGDHSAHINTGAIASDALVLAGETFICASDVVIVGEGNLNEIAAASQLAAAVSGPLLFPEPRLAAELGRLKPERVHLIGTVEVNVPGAADTVNHDVASAVSLAAERLGVNEEATIPATPNANTIVETVLAIETAERVVTPATPVSSTTLSTELVVSDIVLGLAAPSAASSLWLVDASRPATILLAAAVGNAIGAAVVPLDGSDVLGYPEVGAAMEGHGPETMRYVGAIPEASEWELAVLANGRQIPGGGFFILPEGENRRYVSFYGHPGTDDLGVLGEQGPAETLTRMGEFLDAYDDDGHQVVAAFEIIASVASGGATDDNDYSYEWPPEKFDPWIEFARENDVYVLLDLQPGRDHFLSQAQQYEELLKLPFVGLALDPEWRLQSDQVHLQQVGSVQASEINEVATWLADLVRDNGLPQKLLLLHQFKTSMILNRQDVISRPELQVVVQMDGDGTEAQKDATWSQLKEGAGDAHWAWGWKNFFDEDEPGPPSPESTMAKEPSPIYVSYQ